MADCLKRVCGFSKYNEPSASSTVFDLSTTEALDSALNVEDPVVTLVCSNGLIFLAVIRLLDIHIDSTSLAQLPAHTLHKPNVRVHSQIMCLAPTGNILELETWESTGLFEAGAGNSGLRSIEGLWVDVVNPALKPWIHGVNIGSPTYTFDTKAMQVMAAVLQYEKLGGDLH